MIRFNPLIFGGFDLTGGGGPAGAVEWKSPVATEAALPTVGNTDGDARVALDTDKIYVWDATTSKWIDSKLTTAAFGATPNADGLTVSSVTVGDITRATINLEPADATNPGAVSTTAQTFAGDKTFNDDVVVVGEIDAQSGVGSSNGTLKLGLPNTTTVYLGDYDFGNTTSIVLGADVDGNLRTIDNVGIISNVGVYTATPTTNDAVNIGITTTSIAIGSDNAAITFSESNPSNGQIAYVAGGNLELLATTSVNLNSPTINLGQIGGTTTAYGDVVLDSPNVDIGQVGGTTDIVGTVTIEYNPADPTDWAPAPTHVIEAIDQLADRFVEQDQVTKEPTGFVNRTDSTLTFSDSAPARTFTITPVGSFDFYVKGKKFTKTIAESIVISATAGDHYIYYDDTGVLQESTDPNFVKTIILEYAYVAVVYWNTDTNTHTYFGDERHGLVMDGATHGYLHTVFGARFISGLALNFSTIPTTVDGTGNSASDAQFPSDQGKIRDEDILHEIPVQSQISILYRQGSLWRKKTADAYPLIYQGTAGYGAGLRLPYNQYTGGAWQLTEVQDSKFVLVHYFGTNDINNPFIGIQGIAEYNSIEDARINANTEISSLSGLPFTEFVPVGSVIFQTRTVYANTPKARIRSTDTGANYVDFRGSQLYVPAGTATTHGLLSGLGNDDHFQYLLADGTRAMSGALDMGTHQINNVVDPTSAQDAATKNYVDGLITSTTPSSVGSSNSVGVATTLARADHVHQGVSSVAKSGDPAIHGAVTLSGNGAVSLTQALQNIEVNVPTANLTEATSSVLTITGGTNSVLSATSIEVKQSSGAQSGYLSSTDWTTFNSKQPAGNYITALTGEVTASGPGSVASTITANAVTNAKLAQMPASTLKGNNTGLAADPTDLSASDVRALLSVLPSFAGDIQRTTFVALDNTITPTNVTGLAFANGTVRGFDTILSVERNTTYAEYSLKGIQKGASWEMSQDYIGDETGLTFSITSAGQIQYISTNTTFNAILKFRALSV